MRRILPVLCIAIFLTLQSCASVLVSKEMAAEYYALAEGYVSVSKYDAAIPYYKKAAARKEFGNAAQYGLARAYALTLKWDDACRILSRLNREDPENTLVSTSYAYALVSKGDIDESLDLYGKIYARFPEDPVLARNYAELLFLAGKYDETTAQIAVIKEKFADTDGAKDIDALEKKVSDALAPKEEPAQGSDAADGAADAADGAAPVEASGGEKPQEASPPDGTAPPAV